MACFVLTDIFVRHDILLEYRMHTTATVAVVLYTPRGSVGELVWRKRGFNLLRRKASCKLNAEMHMIL